MELSSTSLWPHGLMNRTRCLAGLDNWRSSCQKGEWAHTWWLVGWSALGSSGHVISPWVYPHLWSHLLLPLFPEGSTLTCRVRHREWQPSVIHSFHRELRVAGQSARFTVMNMIDEIPFVKFTVYPQVFSSFSKSARLMLWSQFYASCVIAPCACSLQPDLLLLAAPSLIITVYSLGSLSWNREGLGGKENCSWLQKG